MRACDFTYLADAPPVALAHRGGAAYGPNRGLENTLAAFGRAVDMGYRYLETDVHATRDGQAGRVPRLGARPRVRRERRDRLAAYDRGPRGPGRRQRADPAPRVSSSSEFPDVRVNIDIKADTALEPTIREVLRHGADRAGLHRLLLRAPAAGRPRRARATGRDRRRAGGHRAAAVHPVGAQPPAAHPGPGAPDPALHRVRGRTLTLVTPGLVRRAHALGKHVHVWFHAWSQEDAAEMHRLLDLGVDGIVTDHIDVLRDVLAERATPLTPAA